MRILQVLSGISDFSAGPTYSVGSLNHHLHRRGHQATVVALGKVPDGWPYEGDVRVFEGLAYRLHLLPVDFIRYLRREMSTGVPILHGHGVWRAPNLFPLLKRRADAAKLVWSPRGMFSEWSWGYRAAVKRPFWEILQKPALQRVDCFHATAESEVEDVRRLGFEQPVALVPNGVEIPDLTGIPKRGRSLVFLSRIHEKKGLHLLLPAWRAVADRFPDWELCIAGKLDSTYADSIQRMALEQSVPRVRFLGELLAEHKRRFLAEARLFVLPTFSENFGIAVAEAFAHGTPVITTTETPWEGAVERQCGWIIEPDESQLRACLTTALSRSDAELAEMGVRGRAWMERDYSWAKVAEDLDAVYQWLASGGAAPDSVRT